MAGKAHGVSNYENYTWMPDRTFECCRQIAMYLHMRPGESILDFGCARGYYVRALREMGFKAYGYDISGWAIENADEYAKPFLMPTMSRFGLRSIDWIMAKDVLEHISRSQLQMAVFTLMSIAAHGIFIVVPLSAGGNDYVRREDNEDATHEICWTLDEWLSFLQHCINKGCYQFTVTGGYHVPGIKDSALAFPKSTGFITLRSHA